MASAAPTVMVSSTTPTTPISSSISSTSTSSASTSSISHLTTASPPPHQTFHGPSSGISLMAGSVMGSILLAVVLMGILFLFINCRKKRRLAGRHNFGAGKGIENGFPDYAAHMRIGDGSGPAMTYFTQPPAMTYFSQPPPVAILTHYPLYPEDLLENGKGKGKGKGKERRYESPADFDAVTQQAIREVARSDREAKVRMSELLAELEADQVRAMGRRKLGQNERKEVNVRTKEEKIMAEIARIKSKELPPLPRRPNTIHRPADEMRK